MPKIEAWTRFPGAVRRHLIERMRDRKITLEDLNQLRLWVESSPEVPEGEWYKRFPGMLACGDGELIKTFLLPGQHPKGKRVL